MKKYFGYSLIVMLVFPFLGFLINLKRPTLGNLKITFLIFAVYLAFNTYKENVSDIYGYVIDSAEYKNQTFNEIFSNKDFFYPLLSKILNNIWSEYYFILSVFSLIFFYFYYRLINVVMSNLSSNYKYSLSSLSLYTVYLIVPFSLYIGFRFNLALVYFSWCFIEYYFLKKKKYIYYLLLTPFIHFSFLVFILLPIAVYFINFFSKNRLLVIILFLGSLVFTNPKIAFVVNDITKEYFTESVSKQVEAYASEEGIEINTKRYKDSADKGSFKRSVNRFISEYAKLAIMYAVFIFFLLRKNFLKSNKQLNEIIIVSIIAFSITNIFSSVYHGSRFYALAIVLFFIPLINFYTSSNDSIESLKSKYNENKVFINICSFLVFMNAFNSIYMSHRTIDLLNLFFGNWAFLFIN